MMLRIRYLFFGILFIGLAFLRTAGLCQDSSDEGIGRYEIYPAANFMLLLDTKTGKLWKITIDMSGKAKAEGITVEGIAYSSTDIDTLNSKLKDVDLEGVPEKDKKECRDELQAQFAYMLEQERIKKVLNLYRLPQ
jgi:hypothetical protein